MDIDHMDEQWMDLIFFAIDHGIESVKPGGTLIPFVMTQVGQERYLHRFVCDRLEEGLQQALSFVGDVINEVDFAAVAYDGFVTAEGSKQDAIMIKGYSHLEAEGVLFAQRYRPKKFLKAFQTIGNVVYLGTDTKPSP